MLSSPLRLTIEHKLQHFLSTKLKLNWESLAIEEVEIIVLTATEISMKDNDQPYQKS